MSDEQSPMLLAQATDLPTADDLAETPDIQFTDAIRAKAQELDHKPAKIYEWVRNNIEYALTYGSIQGADQCLQSKMCNDMDTASLLIALLRTSGIYAHYVYGTIEIPIDKAMNWVGGATDPKMVGTIFATNGVPVKTMISGETIKAVQIEHVWVSAFIDYIPSRGAVQIQGDTWIPLDASFKQYNYTQGINIASAVPFDAQSFANQLLSTATTNTTDGSVTNVDSTYVQQTMTDYQTKVQNYIQQNYPNATVGDVIGKKEINPKEYHFLPCTLPYKAVQVGSEYSRIPDNLRETISFSIPDPTGSSAGLNYTIGMPQIAGKKITLSFSPATDNDEAVIKSLLPQPNPDGTPIDPSQLPTSFPAYLINLVPELRVDGQKVVIGATSMMGSDQSFIMSISEPSIGRNDIDYIVRAGQYSGIGIDVGKLGIEFVNHLRTKLETTKNKLESRDYNDISKDDIAGDLFYTAIATYLAALDTVDNIGSHLMNVIRYRVPSIGMFSLVLDVHQVFGVPISATSNSMMMDAKRIMQAVYSRDGNVNDIVQYMHFSGVNSSYQEHSIPEKLFSNQAGTVQGISSVKAIQIANSQGIPIYTINRSNSATLLPQLQINEEALMDIVNAINAGKEVTVSQSDILYNGWVGCGYVITDPVTGAGAYMIAGGNSGARCNCAAGGLTFCKFIGILLLTVLVVIAAIIIALILDFIFIYILAAVIAALVEILPALLTILAIIGLIGGIYYLMWCIDISPPTPPGPDLPTTITALCAAILTAILFFR